MDPEQRLARKLRLRAKRWSRTWISRVLFTLLDWVVRLPKRLLLEFKREADRLEGDEPMAIIHRATTAREQAEFVAVLASVRRNDCPRRVLLADRS